MALASLGLLDVLLAVARRQRDTAVALVAAVACAVVGGLAVGLGPAGSAALGASVAIEAPLWDVARRTARAGAVLAALGGALAFRIATAGAWDVEPGSLLDRWVADAPYLTFRAGPDRVAYVLGVLVFLAAAGNTLVRLLLRSVGTLSANDGDNVPGGGRVIGSIERVLIFALAIAGEPTAATLVISAKGILRFAEVRTAARADVDPITEYVLVGSLASYALALAFVPFA